MLDKKTPLKAHNHSKNTLCQTLTAGTGRPDAPYRGGELVVLDALVFLDYQPGDVVILAGTELFHAVMPMVPLGKNDPKRHSLVLFSEDPAYTAMRDALTRAANATPKAPAEPVDPTAGDAELARCLALGLQPRRARRGRGPSPPEPPPEASGSDDESSDDDVPISQWC